MFFAYYIYNVEEKFKCPHCGNEDPRYIGIRNGKLYCRRCLTFKSPSVPYVPRKKGEVNYVLNFKLSEEQKEIAEKLKENYILKKDSLLYAVCGAGKTEIVYEVIRYVLSEGKRVGFAIPRRDVVIELEPRLKKAFPSVSVVSVYGGHSEHLLGDITILTTHQLFRYENYFDLLIVDEIDAFPYQNNEVLQHFFEKSYRFNYIFMSATPSDEIFDKFSKNNAVLMLNKRFHGYKIPCPKIMKLSKLRQLAFIVSHIRKYLSLHQPLIIFAPTKEIVESLGFTLKLVFKDLDYIHSQRKDKDRIISDFKDGNLKVLIATTLLERGITIDNLQVIVYQSDHALFNHQTLTQISGRVGRNPKHPKGDVYYLAERISEEMQKSVAEINTANADM